MLAARKSTRLATRLGLLTTTTTAGKRDLVLDSPLNKPELVVKRARTTRSSSSTSSDKESESSNPAQEHTEEDIVLNCLPRTRELKLQSDGYTVMGVDEAGRGPLAGPVVAAAAWVPSSINGVIDSKQITNEDERERLYEEIVASNVKYAVAIIDAARIDEINILQATLEGMRLASMALMSQSPPKDAVTKACISREGSYVVCSPSISKKTKNKKKTKWFALVDGNRLPNDMPCEAESIIKGDSKEYAIAAASILAKVTRDRLMRAYHDLYPQFNLAQHKGYPTAAHMALVKQHGASPIHRRTFAPLKHMALDEQGRIMDEE